MTDLTPTCALGATTPRSLRLGAFGLTECPDVALASLALRRDAPRPDATLPEAGFWAETALGTAFWTGPDQWMIEGPGLADTDFAAQVARGAPGCSVTDQTDGWVLFDLSGPVERVLERAVNLDPARLAPGQALRSVIDHMPVLLVRRAPDRLGIWGMRSSAESLWHALERMLAHLSAR